MIDFDEILSAVSAIEDAAEDIANEIHSSRNDIVDAELKSDRFVDELNRQRTLYPDADYRDAVQAAMNKAGFDMEAPA